MNVKITPESLKAFQNKMRDRYPEVLRRFDFFSTPALLGEEEIQTYLGQRNVNVPCVICDRLSYGDTRVNHASDFKGNDLYAIIPFVYIRLFLGGKDRYFNLFAISDSECALSGEIKKARFHCFNLFMKLVVPFEDIKEKDEERVVSPMSVNKPNDVKEDREECSVLPSSQTKSLGVTLPAWKDKDPLSLSTYDQDYDEIEFDHEGYAEIVVHNMSDHHIVAPGDGSGLFARICFRRGVSGTFGDLVLRPSTFPSVVQETIESTVERGNRESGGKPVVYVLSYISHWISALPSGKSIIIDVPEAHSKFGTVRCSPFVSSTFDLNFSLVVPQDKFRTMSHFRRIPYLGNLMCLTSVRINRLTLNTQALIRSGVSKVFSLNGQVRKFCEKSSFPIATSYSVEVVDSISDAVDDEFYLVPIGRLVSLPSVVIWNGFSPLRVRTVYEVGEDIVLPDSMDFEYYSSKKYCYVSDDKKRILRRDYNDGENFFSDVMCVPLLESFIMERLEIIASHWKYPKILEPGNSTLRAQYDGACVLDVEFRSLHPDYGGLRSLVEAARGSGMDFVSAVCSVLSRVLTEEDCQRIIKYDSISYSDDDPDWSTYGQVLYDMVCQKMNEN